jgi:hypothetical protein
VAPITTACDREGSEPGSSLEGLCLDVNLYLRRSVVLAQQVRSVGTRKANHLGAIEMLVRPLTEVYTSPGTFKQ